MKEEIREKLENSQIQFSQRNDERKSNRLYEKIRKQEWRKKQRLGRPSVLNGVGPLSPRD